MIIAMMITMMTAMMMMMITLVRILSQCASFDETVAIVVGPSGIFTMGGAVGISVGVGAGVGAGIGVLSPRRNDRVRMGGIRFVSRRRRGQTCPKSASLDFRLSARNVVCLISGFEASLPARRRRLKRR